MIQVLKELLRFQVFSHTNRNKGEWIRQEIVT